MIVFDYKSFQFYIKVLILIKFSIVVKYFVKYSLVAYFISCIAYRMRLKFYLCVTM